MKITSLDSFCNSQRVKAASLISAAMIAGVVAVLSADLRAAQEDLLSHSDTRVVLKSQIRQSHVSPSSVTVRSFFNRCLPSMCIDCRPEVGVSAPFMGSLRTSPLNDNLLQN